MKLLAFADLHNDMKTLDTLKQTAVKEHVDLVLCAGDMTTFGRNQQEVMKAIAEFPVPVLVIHGNHENADVLKTDCEPYNNLFFLHSASYRKDHVIVFGYGGGGFDERDPAFVEVSKKFKEDIRENDIAVMMFHGPPYGLSVDFLNGRNVGNKDYAQFCKKNSIRYVISGHIEETEGAEETIGGTTYLNPGPHGRIIEL
jgi:Icc-related predicted phosphoesterase